MQRLSALPLLALGVLSLSAQTPPFPIAPAAVAPKVDLVYRAPMGTVFDANCDQMLKSGIDAEAVKAAIARAPELQRLINRELGAYLSATYDEIGMPHPYREVQATLTVCPGVQSMSAPLFLNVSRFLPTAKAQEPDWYFVEITYHELMHTYTAPAQATSALAKKYTGEQRVTLNHLYVMALEKFVLLKLGRAEELKHVGERYRQSASAAYPRAWEIVDKLEDYQAFVKELKDYAARKR